jgi:ATP-binding cassette subfamily E protein 1
VAIVLTLSKSADIYLIDEPNICFNFKQRIIAARVIKRFIIYSKKTAFVVEHDFIIAIYLINRVIIFDSQPSVNARANTPESLFIDCNKFLQNLNIIFRRDSNSFRPRINKYQNQLN